MMNEVAENVLVCVISYVGPFVFGKYKGREGSPGWRVAACSALVDQAVFQSASSSFPSHQQCNIVYCINFLCAIKITTDLVA